MPALGRDGGQRWVVVRVEAIILHFDPASLLGRLLLLAPSPEKDTCSHEESYDDDRDNNSDRSGAGSAEASATSALL